MQFGALFFLSLVALVPLLGLLLALSLMRRLRGLTLFVGAGQRSFLSPAHSLPRQAIKALLLVVATALVVLALARPQWGGEPRPVHREGSDIMVVLDVSLSMQATDVAPSRLVKAKAEVSQLLNRLEGDRVGLVVFAGDAALRFPLTSDISVADRLIQTASPAEARLRGGTALDRAISLASAELSQSAARAKVILLVSDGEDQGSGSLAAAQDAAKQGIAIFALGIGTDEGSPIPIRDESGNLTLKTDATTGGPVVSRLDADLLRALASATDGSYWPVDDSSSAYAAVAGQMRELKRTPFLQAEGRQPSERFQPFLAAAVLLLLVEHVISDSRPLARARRGAR